MRKLITALPVVPEGHTMIFAILVDDQNNQQTVELGLEEVLKVEDYFSPCGHCSSTILHNAWYGVKEADCCAYCGITCPDSEPLTREEAEDFIAGCINYFKGGFHPDTLGESYINRDDTRTFTDEEAMSFNNNMNSAFKFFNDTEEGDIYRWGMDYLTSHNIV